MNLNQAETLGGIVRAIKILLSGYVDDIGKGRRLNLLVPHCLNNGESIEHGEAGILTATSAVINELLFIDDHLLEDVAIRDMFRVFIRSVFEPPVVGGGKFILEERSNGLVFFLKD